MRWKFLLLLSAAALASFAQAPNTDGDEKKIELPAGFSLETVAAEPLLMNPVAFSIDEKLRIFVAETHRLDNAVVDITKNTNWIRDDLALRTVSMRERFLTNAFGTNAYILTRHTEQVRELDMDLRGVVSTSRVAWNGFWSPTSGLMAGVLARDNSIWLTCIPSLFRMDDPGGTNQTRVTLSTGYGVHIGVTGHDLHGLTMGPDGKIYFSMGDRGLSVRFGPVSMNYQDTGSILRCNPDGSALEVFATGFRNPQELTFDELGNLWTADNDTAGEDKSRLIYVVEGGDYGWRTSYQHMKDFGPWVKEKVWQGGIDGVLPNSGEPAQGPSGFAYYPGTGLPKEMEGRFLLCDFPGGIQSFTAEPKGASYVIKDKKRFLWNCWPTDVEFGPDGALYFSDWVGGWSLPNKGRIYRVTHPDVAKDPKTIETARILQGGFTNKDSQTLIGYLEHHDFRVRRDAHLALTKRKDAIPALRELALNGTKGRPARVHAIWALRLQGGLDAPTVDKLIVDSEPEIRAQAVLSAGTTNIVKLLKDGNARVRLFAAQALQKKALFDPNNSVSAEAILDFLEKNNDEDAYLTHAGVRVLMYSQPALAKARKHKSLAVRRAAMLATRDIGSVLINGYLDDPALMVETARAIYDTPIQTGMSRLAERLTTNCPPAAMSRVINANLRVGGAEAANRLARFARSEAMPVEARVEALECLASWQEPDVIDRVTGLWRPIPPDVQRRAETVAVNAMRTNWPALLSDKNPAVVKAALRCVAELEVAEQGRNVLAIVENKSLPPDVRGEALSTLNDLAGPTHPDLVTNFVSALEGSLKDDAVRIRALQLVQTNSPAAVVNLVIQVAAEGAETRARQAALGVVGRLTPPQAVEPLKRLVDQLGKKQISTELALDVLEAARKFPDLKDAADAAAKSAFSDPATEPLLVGGDAAEGRRVFVDRSDVACSRCHSVGGNGGSVGPALDHIGGKQKREYLLESILFPNKQIAEGFETLLITFTDNKQAAGRFLNQSALTLEIDVPGDGPWKVNKVDIKKIDRGLSAMPDGLGEMLSPFDLRNLVEYLASLK